MVFVTALRKELLEQWRTRRVLVVAAVLLIFGLLSPLLARYTPELISLLPEAESLGELIPTPTVSDAVGQYLENMSQFGVILALLAVGLMAFGAFAFVEALGRRIRPEHALS